MSDRVRQLVTHRERRLVDGYKTLLAAIQWYDRFYQRPADHTGHTQHEPSWLLEAREVVQRQV